MTITWQSQHHDQGGDRITEIHIKLVNSKPETLKKLMSGIELLRVTEYSPLAEEEADIFFTDDTTYDWFSQTYSGAMTLHLNDVDNATYKTRCGHMRDLTFIPIPTEREKDNADRTD